MLKRAFPGILAINQLPTADDVARIETCVHDNHFIAGVLEQGSHPLWWLECSSYTIEILAPERVQ